MKFKTVSFFYAMFSMFALAAQTFFVDNLKGNNENDGSRERPFATLYKACAEVCASGRIEVANTGKPYQMPYLDSDASKSYGYRLRRGGTFDQPLVVEGNGAVLSGLAEVPAEKWKAEGGNLFSLPFYPMCNRYKNSSENYWLDSPRIWFVNGDRAANAKSKDELLKTPGGFWWNKAEKRVLFHLSTGKTLEELKIELPANYGFYLHEDYTVVRNFTFIFSVNDGFDADENVQHGFYINCMAYNNCGQGMSVHRNSNIHYINCGAVNCASSNVCNVDQSNATYVNCVFLDNAYENNISLYGEAAAWFYGCLISGGKADVPVLQENSSKLSFVNSVVQGDESQPLWRGRGGSITFRHCTLLDARYLGDFSPGWSSVNVTVRDCVIGRMKNAIAKLSPQSGYPRLFFDGNRYSGGFFSVDGKPEKAGESEWLREKRIDPNSSYIEPAFSGIRNSESDNAFGAGAAKFSPAVKRIYDRLTRLLPMPDGLREDPRDK